MKESEAWPISIEALGKLAVGSLLWRAQGRLHLTVIAKARFALRHNGPMELLDPEPLVRRAQHFDDDPERSLRQASDLVPYLKSTDVLFRGHAYGPPGMSAAVVAVRLAVLGDVPLVDKTLHVYGERDAGAPLLQARPFSQMPLTYERAGGAVPNVVDPHNGEALAGFGPIPMEQRSRRPQLAAALGKALLHSIVELPAAFDWTLFQAAPRDQRSTPLTGNEWIVLEGLHPAIVQLRSCLPDVSVEVVVWPRSGGRASVALVADTLSIDGDAQTCTLTWRGSFPVYNNKVLEQLTIAAGLSLGATPVDWSEVEPDELEDDVPQRLTTVIDESGTLGLAGEGLAGEGLAGEGLAGERSQDLPPPTVRQEPALLREDPPAVELLDDSAVESVPPSELEDAAQAAPPSEGEDATTARRSLSETTRRQVMSPQLRAIIEQAKKRPPGDLESTMKVDPAALQAPATPFEAGDQAAPSDTDEALVDSAPTARLHADADRAEEPDEPRKKAPVLEGTVAVRPGARATAATPFERAPEQQPRTAAHDLPPVEPADVSADLPRGLPSRAAIAQPSAQSTVALSPGQRFTAVSPFPLAKAGTPPLVLRPAPLLGAPWVVERGAAVPIPTAGMQSTVQLGQQAEQQPPSPHAAPSARPRTVPFEIVAPGAVSVATLSWQLEPPIDSITVIAKASFALVPGESARLCQEADPPVGDVHYDDDHLGRSVIHGSDFAPRKQKVDVTLTGKVYAAAAARSAEVRFRFGDDETGFERRAKVFGERIWRAGAPGGTISKAAPFDSIPMCWENAFGGAGFDANPVGTGRAAEDKALRMPNIEDPEHLLRGPKESHVSICFAPIPMLWRAKMFESGTYDEVWLRERWPYMPADFDDAFYQNAPQAQQLDHIRGDEAFSIGGMHAEYRVLEGTLPGMRARCFVQGLGQDARFVELPMNLDTVSFELERMRLHLVWRGVLPVSDHHASNLEGGLLLLEPLGDEPLSLPDARERYLLERRPLEAVEQSPDGAPQVANDVALASHQPGREPGLAGLQASDPAARFAAPPTDREAVAQRMRDAGAPDEQIAAALSVLASDSRLVAAPTSKIAIGPSKLPPPTAATVRDQVTRWIHEGRALADLDLEGASLQDMDLSGARFAGAVLKGANLSACQLVGADLSDAILTEANLEHAVLREAILDRADLRGAQLSCACLEQAQLDDADLSGVVGSSCNFRKARGERLKLREGDWRESDFEGAELSKLDLSESLISRCSFASAKLVDVTLYDARGSGVQFDGADLSSARGDGAVLPSSSLVGIGASDSVFEGALLDKCSFFEAVLSRSSFVGASCKSTIFSRADLREARFDEANLSGASLLKSDLKQASLQRADLRSSDLRGANLYGCDIWKVELSGARLEMANLYNTLMQDKGRK